LTQVATQLNATKTDKPCSAISVQRDNVRAISEAPLSSTFGQLATCGIDCYFPAKTSPQLGHASSVITRNLAIADKPRATYALCKRAMARTWLTYTRNAHVPFPIYNYHAEFGRSALKDIRINTGEPPKLGSACMELDPLLDRRRG